MKKYKLVMLMLSFNVFAEDNGSSKKDRTAIEYPSVEAARTALLLKPGVDTVKQEGWLIISDPATRTMWTFTTHEHEAYPALVKRTVIEEGSRVFVKMDVLCEASKSACHQLVNEFNDLNKRMHRDIPMPMSKM